MINRQRKANSRGRLLAFLCLTFLLSLFRFSLPANAASIDMEAGTSGAQFLKLGAGGRAGGMADSFSAVADDVSAAYYNPGALYRLTGPQIAGSHTQYFQGTNYEVLQFAYPFGRTKHFSRHTWAVGIYYLSIDRIERRTADTTDPTGTFNSGDGAYALTYTYGVNRQLGLGLTGKGISQTIDTYHAGTFAADAGVHYRLNPDGKRPVSVAAVVKNMGAGTRFARNQSRDRLPLSGTVGLAVELVPKRLRLNIEGSKYRDIEAFGAAGAEYVHPFMDGITASIRTGYSSHYRDIGGLNGFTLGTGFSYYKAAFDFAWVPYGYLGHTFRYSLLIKF